MRDRLVVEQDRQGRDRIPLVACVWRLPMPCSRAPGYGVRGHFPGYGGGIHRGTLDQSRQQGGFLDVEFVGSLLKKVWAADLMP